MKSPVRIQMACNASSSCLGNVAQYVIEPREDFRDAQKKVAGLHSSTA
jgi:hypothetical protein